VGTTRWATLFVALRKQPETAQETFVRTAIEAGHAVEGACEVLLDLVLWRRPVIHTVDPGTAALVATEWDAFLVLRFADEPRASDAAIALDRGVVAEHDRWVMDSRLEHARGDERARGSIKTLGAGRRLASLTRSEYGAHVRDVHVPLVLSRNPTFLHYVTNIAVGDGPWDGLTELWYPSHAAYTAQNEGRSSAVREDIASMCAHTQGWLVSEARIR
jgi:hypothetical protein